MIRVENLTVRVGNFGFAGLSFAVETALDRPWQDEAMQLERLSLPGIELIGDLVHVLVVLEGITRGGVERPAHATADDQQVALGTVQLREGDRRRRERCEHPGGDSELTSAAHRYFLIDWT